jgi:hypothetical protein
MHLSFEQQLSEVLMCVICGSPLEIGEAMILKGFSVL